MFSLVKNKIGCTLSDSLKKNQPGESQKILYKNLGTVRNFLWNIRKLFLDKSEGEFLYAIFFWDVRKLPTVQSILTEMKENKE